MTQLARFASTGGGAGPADPQFNYVTMLLHGDGTNGAQNNTFVDSSSNNFTITRNGNTTQGSFSPYGSNWSNFFNGSSGAGGGPYLSFPNSSTMQLGAGNFTIEAWCYFNVVQESTIIARYPFDSTNNEWNFGTGSSLIPNFSYTTGGNTTAGSVGGSGALSTNTWYHIAVVRNSSTLTMYINGTSVATSSISATIYSGTTTTTVGCYAQSAYPGGYAVPNGYLSNVRVVKGTAVYTSNFTPSTTPLTAISGTSLLTCQSNRFVDNSTNNFAVTLNSTPSVQRFNPFGTSTAYSTSVIGGSGYFDGSGDYLSAGNQTALHLGSGNFTVEMWLYKNSNGSYMTACGDLLTGSTNTFQILGDFGGTKIAWYNAAVNNFTLTSTASIPVGAWTHIAFVRSSTTLTLYVNGVSDSTASLSTNYNATTSFFVGHTPELIAGRYWDGYISNLRIVKGTAVYTAAFTPPTAPLTAVTNTSLLLLTTNAAIFDNAMMNDLETVGNAQISTTVKKYGTGSLAFDGTGDYLTGKSNPIYAIGTANFTVEAWVYPTAFSAYRAVFDTRTTLSNGGMDLGLASSSAGVWGLYKGSAVTVVQSSTNLTLNTWQHIAAVRSGSTVTLYLDGVSVGSATDAQDFTEQGCHVGRTFDNYTWSGYIDDLRVTRGYARYTANFTPPTQAFFNN